MAKAPKAEKELEQPNMDDPRVPAMTAETAQTWDGETDPAVLIKAGNQRRVYEQHGLPWPPPKQEIASIQRLDPDEAEIGGEEVTMTVTGTCISPDAKIIFNGGEEETTVISDTECSTIVKPSLAGAVVDVPVLVRNTLGDSNELVFSFVEPVARKSAAKTEDKDDEEDDEKASKTGKKTSGKDDDKAESKGKEGK